MGNQIFGSATAPCSGLPISHMDNSARQGFRHLLKDYVLFVVRPIII